MKAALRVLGAVLTIVVTGVLLTIGVVWVYSTLVAPGKPVAAYEQFAQTAGPWVSVVAGPVITYLVVRRWTRSLDARNALRMAIWIMAMYLLVDIAVLAGNQPEISVWGFAAVSAAGRCLGAWLAARR